MTFQQIIRWLVGNLDILVVLLAFGGPVIAGIFKHLAEQARKRAEAVRRERAALEELRTGRRLDDGPSALATLGDTAERAPSPTSPTSSPTSPGAPRPQTTLVRLPGGVVIEMPLPPEAQIPGSQTQRQPGPQTRTSPSRPTPSRPTPARQAPRPQPHQPAGVPGGMSQGGLIAQAQRKEASGKRDAKQDKVDKVVRGQVRQAQREDEAKRRAEVAARDRARAEREAEDKAAMAAAFANPTEKATDAQSKRATQAGASLGAGRGPSLTSAALNAQTASGMSKAELRRALVMQELLAAPVSMREAQGAWKPPT